MALLPTPRPQHGLIAPSTSTVRPRCLPPFCGAAWSPTHPSAARHGTASWLGPSPRQPRPSSLPPFAMRLCFPSSSALNRPLSLHDLVARSLSEARPCPPQSPVTGCPSLLLTYNKYPLNTSYLRWLCPKKIVYPKPWNTLSRRYLPLAVALLYYFA